MLRAVIFDLDGTIIDSEPLHTEAVLRILRDFSIELTEVELDKYIGISSSVMWRDMCSRFSLVESIEELKIRQHRMNIEMLETSGSILIPGIPELLAVLKARGIAMAIASSSTREYIESVVEAYGLEKFFDHRVSGEDVPRGKPWPDIFLKAAELLGIPPDDCVIIEDSDNGLTAARGAGIKSVGFRNPNSGNQTLSMADKVVDGIPEISFDFLMGLVTQARAG